MKFIKRTIYLSIAFFLAIPYYCRAEKLAELIKDETGIQDNAYLFKELAGFGDVSNPAEVVAVVLQVFFGILGMIFIILLILSGYNWMTAGGNSEKVDKAKATIFRAIIGLIIIVSAYAITYFVFKNLPGGDGTGKSYPV